MNKKMVLNTLGKIIGVEAALLILPLVVSVIYKNDSIAAFLITIAVAAVVSLPLLLFCKPKNKTYHNKHSVLSVCLNLPASDKEAHCFYKCRILHQRYIP